MRVVVAVLSVALLALVGCGQSSAANSLASQTGTPAAVPFADPSDLYRAIEHADAPRVAELGLGSFGAHMPARAHARRGTFLAAAAQGTMSFPDGVPATTVVAAVFPDGTAEEVGLVYGSFLARGLDWPSIWQLRGPNWVLWSIERDTLQSAQHAIGGSLGRAFGASVEPSPTS